MLQPLDAMISVNVPQHTALTPVQLATDVEIIVAAPELAERWRTATQPKELSATPWVAHSYIPAGAQYHFRTSAEHSNVSRRHLPLSWRIRPTLSGRYYVRARARRG